METKKEKVDLVKLMITGGVLDAKEKGVPGELKMSPDMVRAAATKHMPTAISFPPMWNLRRVSAWLWKMVSTRSSTVRSWMML